MSMSFAYRNGVLCAEQVPLDDIARRFGTPCYVYSRAAIEAAYREFARALQRARLAGLLLGQGELQPRGARAAGAARRRLRHRLGRRAGARARGRRRSRARRCSPASARPRPRSSSALEKSILLPQPRVRRRARARRPRSRGGWGGARRSRFASIPTSTRRRIPTSPPACARTSSASRYADAERLYARGRAPAAHRDRRHRLPHRLAADRARRPSSPPPGASRRSPTGWSAPASRSRHIDIGGGIGIRYRDETPEPIAAFLDGALGMLAGAPARPLIVDPGRSIVGNAGVLLTRVEYVKPGEARNFVVVDAAMNDLIRPALYGAWHEVRPVREPESGAAQRCLRHRRPGLRKRRTSSPRTAAWQPREGDLLASCPRAPMAWP